MSQITLDKCTRTVTSVHHKQEILFQDISLTIAQGETVGLIGRSGSGKTSLSRVLGGLDKPTQGRIRVQPRTMKRMLVLQRPEDHFAFATVSEQISHYAHPRLSPEQIEDMLRQIGLPTTLANASLRQLSGGQQRLVAVGCALATKADILVLDEPMAGLDYNGRSLIKQTLQNLATNSGIGFLIISHHPDDLLGLVQRLLILEKGQLRHDGLFHTAPIAMLQLVLADNKTSLYYVLRQLESQGITLPPSVYDDIPLSEIATILEKATQS